MTRPLPEILNGGKWQTQPTSHEPHTPTANPKRHKIAAHPTNTDPTERTARDHLTALIGSKYNSRRPTALANTLSDTTPYPMPHPQHAATLATSRQLFHAAEELRNRLLAHHTPTGQHTTPPRYHLPDQIARHHADPKTRRNLAHDLAAIIHHPIDLTTYLNTLRTLSPELADLATRTAERAQEQTAYLVKQLQTPEHRARVRMSAHTATRNANRTDQTYARLSLTAAEYAALSIAHTLNNYQQQAGQARNSDQRAAAKKRRAHKQHKGNALPQDLDDLEGWHTVVPNKPPREIAHLGRLGRRRTLSDTGKTPNRIANYCGDPLRRIYTRKTRGTNALIVVDVSGSMRLNTDNLDQILRASHGATVVAYSATDDTTPNTHLLAHNSRRVREMPEFSGGNGNDAPAVAWSIKNYRKHRAPVLWITDGRATGRYDNGNPHLRAQCRRLAERHAITVARTVPEALRDLATLAAGRKPEPRLYTFR